MANEDGIANGDFHEIWFIYSPERHSYGGVRIAHFRKTFDGELIVSITNEDDPRRIGMRIWRDVSVREGWVKVRQITPPTNAEIESAVDTKLRGIARAITTEAGYIGERSDE